MSRLVATETHTRTASTSEDEETHARADVPHDEHDEHDEHGEDHESAQRHGAPEARAQRLRNNVKRLREERLLTKAELARKAGLSALTIDRVEAGMPCRMNTKRKIILALGMTVAEKDKVFERGSEQEEEPDGAVVG